MTDAAESPASEASSDESRIRRAAAFPQQAPSVPRGSAAH
jgi:hypothetical protein